MRAYSALFAVAGAVMLQGCIASTVLDVATLPVKVAGRAVDLATTSQSEAATVRARYTSDLGVARKDIRTTAVDVDTRREALVPFLTKISNTTNGYAFGD